MKPTILLHRLISGILSLGVLLVCTSGALAVPKTVDYQGRLLNASGLPVADSTYSVSFSLYAASSGGSSLWTETAPIPTDVGLFTHALGSVVPISDALFSLRDSLFLEIAVGAEIILPRTSLASVPFSRQSGGLSARNSSGNIAFRTVVDSSVLVINKPNGDTGIVLSPGLSGDSAVVLPRNSIASQEIKDEPGVTVYIQTQPITLLSGMMVDLITLDITIPDDGYIILEGKCYVELSGTTGPNVALIQIDETEGGSSSFPYYTLAGLGGYVSTNASYFPIYVTRPYYKAKGTYTFRMEGRAQNPSPAVAVSWDHVLTATYYPTDYDAVKSVTTVPSPGAIEITPGNGHPGADTNMRYFLIDLRQIKNNSQR